VVSICVFHFRYTRLHKGFVWATLHWWLHWTRKGHHQYIKTITPTQEFRKDHFSFIYVYTLHVIMFQMCCTNVKVLPTAACHCTFLEYNYVLPTRVISVSILMLYLLCIALRWVCSSNDMKTYNRVYSHYIVYFLLLLTMLAGAVKKTWDHNKPLKTLPSQTSL